VAVSEGTGVNEKTTLAGVDTVGFTVEAAVPNPVGAGTLVDVDLA